MSVLIVGGDRITNIRAYLIQQGYDCVKHWDARRNSDCHKRIPTDTQLVILLTDYLNHSMATQIRRKVAHLGLPIIFSKNSVSDLKFVFLDQFKTQS